MTNATDLFSGLGHGLLGLVGLGSVYDPLGDLRSTLSSKITDFNNITADYSYKAQKEQHANLIWFEQFMQTEGAVARKQLESTSQMIWDTIETEKLFIIFLYILVFIIVIYLIIKK